MKIIRKYYKSSILIRSPNNNFNSGIMCFFLNCYNIFITDYVKYIKIYKRRIILIFHIVLKIDENRF